MKPSVLHLGDRAVLEPDDLEALIAALRKDGYRVVGPHIQDGAIALAEITTAHDLPIGWTDEHAPGAYRLVKRHDEARFGYVVGPQSCKQFLHPPLITLFRSRRDADGMIIEPAPVDAPRLAFLGVRPCDIAAIAIQDRVLRNGEHPDPGYRARRDGSFIVAVNCAEPRSNCFCASMRTGPSTSGPFDLALTEVIERGRHFLLLEIGSDKGAAIAADLPCSPAGEEHIGAARTVMERAVKHMAKHLPILGLAETLQQNYEHPRWDETAERCLTCGNCTSVCPTCFCTTTEDFTSLNGQTAERTRRWDSCFTIAFSYIFGGSVRTSVKSRYRQWLLHKLATWHDQFGTPGCVGCGRCITWCPVGIDITVEAAAIHAGTPKGKEHARGNP